MIDIMIRTILYALQIFLRARPSHCPIPSDEESNRPLHQRHSTSFIPRCRESVTKILWRWNLLWLYGGPHRFEVTERLPHRFDLRVVHAWLARREEMSIAQAFLHLPQLRLAQSRFITLLQNQFSLLAGQTALNRERPQLALVNVVFVKLPWLFTSDPLHVLSADPISRVVSFTVRLH